MQEELGWDQESSPPLALYSSPDQDIKACPSECLIGEEVHLGAGLTCLQEPHVAQSGEKLLDSP